MKNTTDERKESRMKHPKRDVYMETTEKIVELLEAGRIPWQKGWDGKIGAQLVGLPINGKKRRKRLAEAR